ncbi:MAG: ABC transporter ATP-binding protein/permease [Candidatus Cloacimonetes bacterium]|nr:ABC transporter ATP-binding protein/permease [Candidatus Cloacimonadota bacterium]
MAHTAFEEQEYSKRFDLSLWRKMMRYAWVYKPVVILLGSTMVFAALLDAVFPLLTRHVIDNYVRPGVTEGLGGFAALYIGLVVVQAINVWGFIALAGKLQMSIIYDIRRDGFDHLQRLPFSYFDRTPLGWLMARITSDCERLGGIMAWGLVDIAWGTTMMLTVTIIMLALNWKLALIALVVVPPLAAASLWFQKRILKNYRVVRKTNSRITGAISEGIFGARTTKTLVREEANLAEYQQLTGKMYGASVRAAVMSALYLPIVLCVATVGSGLVLWKGGSSVIAGALTYGTLVAFISYMMRFFEPIHEVARIFAEMQNAQASAERVFSLLETPVDIDDSDEVKAAWPQWFEGEPPQERLRGEVRFDNVSFAYKKGEQVLSDFNLHVKPGEKIALVGKTGAGKTTIVNLIARFYQPTGGRVLIDGDDYTTMPLQRLQSNIGIVLQSPHLFSGSVMENIRYGRLESSDKEVKQAARLVNADEFIERLEKGYDTEVGEGGSLLSTGQKQMVSFARAILADPSIFVLDEATSSVDTETEHLIQSAVDKLLRGRTSFIIAHRLSTIRSADRILVLEHGCIIEQGSHHELIKLKGRYYQLYTNQFMEEKEREILTA